MRGDGILEVSIASSSANTPGPHPHDFHRGGDGSVSIASSSANTPGLNISPQEWQDGISLNRFFVSEYSRTWLRDRLRSLFSSLNRFFVSEYSRTIFTVVAHGLQVVVSIASSSANTPGHFGVVFLGEFTKWSQSLLRQRILPDKIIKDEGGAPSKSQSLLRQRILPDNEVGDCPEHVSNSSQSLLRQRILPDIEKNAAQLTLVRSQSLLRQRILPDSKSHGGCPSVYRESQSLLRQRILPDITSIGSMCQEPIVSIASSSANTPGP